MAPYTYLLRSYSSTGQDNDYEFVRFQTNSQGRIHWLVKIPKAGAYALRAKGAPFKAPDHMAIELNGQSLRFAVPKTASWRAPAFVDVGRIELRRQGIYRLVLHTDNPQQANKQTMAVWEVQVALLN